MATRSHDGRGEEAEGRIDRQAVFEDLFGYLASARSGAHPHRMATHLLRRTSESSRLVALVDDGRRAAFYDSEDGAVALVPFDEHGLDDREETAGVEGDGPTAWVTDRESAVAWVHPRYRAEDSA